MLNLHVDTLFVLDENGDLVSTNEPYPSGQRRAPALFLSWTKENYICRFRHDVPVEARRQVKDLVAASWPFVGSKQPPGVEKIKAALSAQAPKTKAGGGPAYLFPDPTEPQGDAVLVESSSAHLLANAYADTIPEIDYVQPCCAVLDDNHAVSVCLTVRRTPQTAEAGVDTVSSHRGKGYALKTVAAWAIAVRAEGRIPFYSTSWDNQSSQRVAEKLGLIPFAVEFTLT